MKLGIILETSEHEKAWNAFRLANTALKKGHAVKFFLMGEAVECPEIDSATFDVAAQLEEFLTLNGDLFACGTCLTSRKNTDFEACDISTMSDCLAIVEWADKMLTF